MSFPVYIIAEIGVNHNGNIELAEKLVHEAKAVGANAVKFQTFTANTLVGAQVPKVAYQRRTSGNTETHFEMIKKLELSREHHVALQSLCKKLNIDFLSTPYDVESAKFLNEINVPAFKTASADLVDLDLHHYISSTRKPVYLSVGMGTLGEIEKTLQLYDLYGDLHGGRERITLLHCVANYPCSFESLNLNVIPTLKCAFGTRVGFSDHSVGNLASCLSVALGGSVIEKHFTLDQSLPGPDHLASSNPKEFKSLVEQIRLTEIILGNSNKKIQEEEKEMRSVSRKSLTLAREVKAGAVIQQEDLTLKRPGTGLMAEFKPFLVGKKARKNLAVNELIRFEDVD